jgi:hypothetical protein
MRREHRRFFGSHHVSSVSGLLGGGFAYKQLFCSHKACEIEW